MRAASPDRDCARRDVEARRLQHFRHERGVVGGGRQFRAFIAVVADDEGEARLRLGLLRVCCEAERRRRRKDSKGVDQAIDHSGLQCARMALPPYVNVLLTQIRLNQG